jgi:hypothetical protein
MNDVQDAAPFEVIKTFVSRAVSIGGSNLQEIPQVVSQGDSLTQHAIRVMKHPLRKIVNPFELK